MRHPVLGLLVGLVLIFGTASLLAAQGGAAPTVAAAPAQGTPTPTPTVRCGWTRYPLSQTFPQARELYDIAALSASDIWAVGVANNVGTLLSTATLHWDGQTWNHVPSPDVGTDQNYLYGVAARASNDVWAVGAAYSSGIYVQMMILHWDGNQWSVVPTPTGILWSRLYSVVALAANDAWALGESHIGTLLLHWDGSQWSVSPLPPNNNSVSALAALAPNDVWATGSDILHWNGAQWNVVSHPNPANASHLVSVAARTASDAWAVGSYYLNGTGQTVTEHWDGLQWSLIASPNLQYSTTLEGVAVRSANDTWAVGSSEPSASLAEHWDGALWQIVPITENLPNADGLHAVAAVGANDVWTVGYFNGGIVGSPLPLVLHWTGACPFLSATPTVTGTPPTATMTGTPTATDTPTDTPTLTATPTMHPGHFEDVPPNHTFYTYIECLANRNIISGYPCGGPFEPCRPEQVPYYRPGNNVTRSQASKIVASAAGFTDPVPSTQQTFQDVTPGSTFWLWIERLASRGIIAGYPCGGPFEPCIAPGNRPYFRPGNNLTRGQLAKIAAVAAGFTDPIPSDQQTFEDVPGGSTFWVWVEQAAIRQIIGGYPCGGPFEPCVAPGNRPYYRPGNNVTRGQSAKILANTFFPSCPLPTPTPTATPATPSATPPPLPTQTPGGASATPDRTLTATVTVTGTPPTATITPTNTLTATPFPTPPTCGLAWRVVPSPGLGSITTGLSAVTMITASDGWAVGTYYTSSGPRRTLAMHWDGSLWNIVSSPNANSGDNLLYSVAAVSTNDVWAVGVAGTQTLTLHWNGTSWTVVPSPSPSQYPNHLNSVAVAGTNDVWAVGSANNEQNLIIHWDGTSWSAVPNPNTGTILNTLEGVAVVSPSDVWAVGLYSSQQYYEQTLALHWDGTAWTVVPTPNQAVIRNSLAAITVVGPSDIWAVGSSGWTEDQTLIEHWDGTTWTIVPSPSPYPIRNYLTGVAATGPNDVWAVGYVTDYAANTYQTLIEHWDGTSWTLASSPRPGIRNSLSGVWAVGPGDVWAVGTCQTTFYQTLTAHYSDPCANGTPTPTPTRPPRSPTATPTP